MGQVFAIVEQLDEFRFRFRNTYTGDTIEVEVAPHMRGLFMDTAVPSTWPDPCPFLRQDAGRKMAFCTVHLTRPDVCREYQCWRILVLDNKGKRIARVMDQTYLCLEDESLREPWEKFRECLDALDGKEWDDALIRYFRDLGYTVKV